MGLEEVPTAATLIGPVVVYVPLATIIWSPGTALLIAACNWAIDETLWVLCAERAPSRPIVRTKATKIKDLKRIMLLTPLRATVRATFFNASSFLNILRGHTTLRHAGRLWVPGDIARLAVPRRRRFLCSQLPHLLKGKRFSLQLKGLPANLGSCGYRLFAQWMDVK